jgi:hypothetical protein
MAIATILVDNNSTPYPNTASKKRKNIVPYAKSRLILRLRAKKKE